MMNVGVNSVPIINNNDSGAVSGCPPAEKGTIQPVHLADGEKEDTHGDIEVKVTEKDGSAINVLVPVTTGSN